MEKVVEDAQEQVVRDSTEKVFEVAQGKVTPDSCAQAVEVELEKATRDSNDMAVEAAPSRPSCPACGSTAINKAAGKAIMAFRCSGSAAVITTSCNKWFSSKGTRQQYGRTCKPCHGKQWK